MRSVFNLNAGDGVLEAVSIMENVVKRSRRVFGPAHPSTVEAEDVLSNARDCLAIFDSDGC